MRHSKKLFDGSNAFQGHKQITESYNQSVHADHEMKGKVPKALVREAEAGRRSSLDTSFEVAAATTPLGQPRRTNNPLLGGGMLV